MGLRFHRYRYQSFLFFVFSHGRHRSFLIPLPYRLNSPLPACSPAFSLRLWSLRRYTAPFLGFLPPAVWRFARYLITCSLFTCRIPYIPPAILPFTTACIAFHHFVTCFTVYTCSTDDFITSSTRYYHLPIFRFSTVHFTFCYISGWNYTFYRSCTDAPP